MSDEDDVTKTESLVNQAYQLYVSGVDPALIYKILIEHKDMTPTKAQTIMRWGKARAVELGWL